MTDAPKLKPCPFCGGEASLVEDYGHSTAWEAGCFNVDCLAEPHVWEKIKADAIAVWNTRHTPPEVQALVDALRGVSARVIGSGPSTDMTMLRDAQKVAECAITNWEATHGE